MPVSTPDAQLLDIQSIRQDFPILARRVHDKPLVYLDNAATTQKPRRVLAALQQYYGEYNANVHRGLHALSERATNAFEGARGTVTGFLNAADAHEIVFTRGTTEAINLVAHSFARPRLKPGDEVLITAMEHHSNIVPWQLACEATGATLRVAPIDDDGDVLLDEYEKLLSERTKVVAVVHVSNALGTVNPVQRMIELAHRHGAAVLVDGAQAAPHMPIDVRGLDADFYCLSGHKLFAPTGIGVLYGKAALLREMPPYQGGGEMIRSVTFEKTTYKDPPARFEAGTPAIAQAIGLGAAIEYVQSVGQERIAAHEAALLEYGTQRLGEIDGLRLVGTAKQKAGVLSFVLENAHPHDIATILDHSGVAIRAGHHCAQPVMQRFGVPATARASLAFYNHEADIDALAAAIEKVIEVFG